MLWDPRVWASLGGKGKVGSSRAVFRLKLWWDHMDTGSVRRRALQAKLARAVARRPEGWEAWFVCSREGR